MDFTPEQQFQFFAQTGSLIRFSPGTVFGNTNYHIGVVVNADPTTQKAVVVICASSKVDKARDFARKRGLSPYTIVTINGGSHPHFGQDTAFNCNNAEVISFSLLSSWLTQGQIELMKSRNTIDQTLLDDIRNGVMISDMVEDITKGMLS